LIVPVPVITVEQMRAWENATWAAGRSEPDVIRQAGRAVGRQAEPMTRPGDFVLAVAGKGHNGDDASVAAEFLGQAGRQVQTVRIESPEAARRQLEPWLARGPALILDGLFGIGLNRPLSAPWLDLIQRLNQTGLPILAVDVPSGLNALTGEPQEQAIRAACTVTLGAVKTGLLKSSAWPYVGRLEVAPEIGLISCPFASELSYITAEDFRAFPPARPVAGHKGNFGHLAILAGSVGYHGAAVLAARGAQRAQPGLITLFTMPEAYVPVAAQLQSTMVHPWTPEFELPRTCTAILAGPGLAAPQVPPALGETVRRLWRESPLAMVTDASALAWLPAGNVPEGALRVITPHPGEAARLLEESAAEVQQDRPRALRKLSGRFGHCWVVLKGHQTLIGRGEGGAYVNSSGNPYLAQGGSGDLLGGYVAGLLAQPPLRESAEKTLCYGVWQHGAAADALQGQRRHWTIEDLATMLGSG
jgi:NAD(P)H-hydrate epimerase